MDTIRTFAGECTTRFEGSRSRTQRGHVVVVVKPDRTVLVHDADGYQPVAWLTRPDALTVEADADGFGLTARTDEAVLRVVCHHLAGRGAYPATAAGVPIGDCPTCDGRLVRAGGAVACLGCDARYPLVAGATVLDEVCPDCGLPRMRATRGATFEVCVDRACESFDAAVHDRFDRVWSCPDCGSDLRILRRRGRLLAGCDAYPDCETALSLPDGAVVDDCDCGLPIFETATGRRCLDGTCASAAGSGEGTDASSGG